MLVEKDSHPWFLQWQIYRESVNILHPAYLHIFEKNENKIDTQRESIGRCRYGIDDEKAQKEASADGVSFQKKTYTSRKLWVKPAALMDGMEEKQDRVC